MDDMDADDAAARSVEEERRRIRRGYRLEHVGMLMVAVFITLILGQEYVLANDIAGGGAKMVAPTPDKAWGVVGHLVRGRLSPGAAMVAVLAAATVCATINVALAMERMGPTEREQVAISEWRAKLRMAARLLYWGATLITGAAWLNVFSREAVGAVAITTLFWYVTGRLAVSVRDQVTAADVVSGHDAARREVAKLDAWDRQLASRRVPRPPAGELTARATWWRCLKGCGWRLLCLAAVGAVYLTAVIGAVLRVTDLAHGGVVPVEAASGVNEPRSVVPGGAVGGRGVVMMVRVTRAGSLGWFRRSRIGRWPRRRGSCRRRRRR